MCFLPKHCLTCIKYWKIVWIEVVVAYPSKDIHVYVLPSLLSNILMFISMFFKPPLYPSVLVSYWGCKRILVNFHVLTFVEFGYVLSRVFNLTFSIVLPIRMLQHVQHDFTWLWNINLGVKMASLTYNIASLDVSHANFLLSSRFSEWKHHHFYPFLLEV